MNKLILPINEPLIQTYPVDANAVMIISNNKEYKKWLFNNFIQITSRCSNRPITYFDFHYRNCPLIYFQKISKELVNIDNKEEFLKFLIKAIDNKYYVYLIVNRKYIKAYSIKVDAKHDMLIFGYNKKKRTFHIADAFKNGNYDFGTCSFTELFKSVKNLSKLDNKYMGFNNSIELLSIKEIKEWDGISVFSDRIKESIIDYYECKPTRSWYTQTFEWHNSIKKHLFGLDCYEIIYNELKNLHNQKFVNLKAWLSFNIIYEHKKVMLKRLKYLKEKNMLNIDQSLIKDFSVIKEKSHICRNKMIKFDFNKDENILMNVHNTYKKLESLEKNFLKKLIKTF